MKGNLVIFFLFLAGLFVSPGVFKENEGKEVTIPRAGCQRFIHEYRRNL